jgi:2-polyprenyl-3-methyl-5-hydroxy-6-metoxy-1,4-benzoquinol methylase
MNFPQKTLQKILSEVKGKSVLDIGGAGQGTSENSENWLFGHLQRKARSLIGIDVVPCSHPNVLVANAETFELNQKFDVITMFDVIEHLDNVGQALIQIKQHLLPGGRLLITTPNMSSVGPVLDTILFRGVRSNPTHTLGYNSRMLRFMLKKHGFRLKRLEYLCLRHAVLELTPFI